MAGVGDVHGVLGEDHRVVVGEGHAPAAALGGDAGDLLGRGLVHQAVHVLRLGDVPVLAELAGEVAAGGAEGKDAAAGEEVVERLLLDGVDAEAGAAPVGGEHDAVAGALAHEAGAALAVAQLAVARAEVALDAAVVEDVPPAAGVMLHYRPSFHFPLHLVARDAHFFVPEIRRQAGLALQLLHELHRVGQAFPHLRQEGAAVAAVLEDDAVDAGDAAGP
jgi:hypothetical protein